MRHALPWIQIEGIEMQAIRRLGDAVLMMAFVGVWLGMKRDGHHTSSDR